MKVWGAVPRRVAAVCAVAAAWGWGPGAGALAGQRTDVLHLLNGDRVTGELRELSQGKLSWKTDDMATLSVEWDKVARIRSTRIFEVTLTNGERVFGSLREADAERRLVILGDTLSTMRVVAIVPIEAGFFRRTRGRINLGFTFAKANSASTLTADTQARYRGQTWGANFDGSSYFQSQTGSDATTRNDAQFAGQRYFTGRWAAFVSVAAAQNDELNLALRAAFGAGAQLTPVRSNRTDLTVLAGLFHIRERYGGSDEVTRSLELGLGGQWDVFRYDYPKLNLSLSATPLFSLTSLGRVKLESSGALSYEVFRDFNAGVNVRFSADTDPPDEGASKTDYTLSLTIGWSWN